MGNEGRLPPLVTGWGRDFLRDWVVACETRGEFCLIGFKEFLGDGEELEGSAVPFGDAVESEAVVGLVAGGESLEERGEFGEEGLAGFEAGEEALADEAGDQELEFEFGGVSGGALGVVAFDGT